MSRLLSDLDKRVFNIASDFIQLLKDKDIRYVVLETRRSPMVQLAYYSRGRDNYETIREKYRSAGLTPPSEDEAGYIITRTRLSRHIDGLALDVAPLNSNGFIPWAIRDETTAARWMEIGELGEQAGLAWGGRWTDPKTGELDKWGLGWDLPHFEYKEA